MKFSQFENIISSQRMNRYLIACGNDTKKSMTLYRLNLRLSQEFYTIISCFEVALRNVINKYCTLKFGNDWLRDGAKKGGIFDINKCKFTVNSINETVKKLDTKYTNYKLVAELGFGFWRYLFADNQYKACDKILMQIFPSKPKSSVQVQYNNKFVFKQLAVLNDLRNRIAHHEPICFKQGQPVRKTILIRKYYKLIKQYFQWMSIDESALLYGLDHITKICDKINNL